MVKHEGHPIKKKLRGRRPRAGAQTAARRGRARIRRAAGADPARRATRGHTRATRGPHAVPRGGVAQGRAGPCATHAFVIIIYSPELFNSI